MALIRALNSAVSGLKANQYKIDVIGDNMANATTPGYKASRVIFKTLLTQILSYGTAPTGELGGIDPVQIGLGVTLAEVTKNFAQGELEVTGMQTDMGIDGAGFFILKDSAGNLVFTRDGSFSINPANILHNPSNGYIVQGINADYTTFTIVSGAPLEGIKIPVGELQIAVATSSVKYAGNLNGGGDLALNGTVLESLQFRNGVGGPAAVSGTPLVNLARVSETGGPDIDLGLDTGDYILVRAKKGGRVLPETRFRVGTSMQEGDDGFGTTLGDFTKFLERVLGINTGDTDILISAIRDDDLNPNTPGVTAIATGFEFNALGQIIGVRVSGTNFVTEGVQINDIVQFNTGEGAGHRALVSGFGTTGVAPNDIIYFTAPLPNNIPQPNVGDAFSVHEPPRVSIGGFPSDPGKIRIAGNVGSANEITDLEIVTSDGVNLSPFYTIQSANGESVITNITVYDAIGNPHIVEVTFVLEIKGGVEPVTTATGNTFRFYAEAKDSKLVQNNVILGTDRIAGTGTVTFSTGGQFLAQNPQAAISLMLPNQGTATPLVMTPDHSKLTGFSAIESQVFLQEQDGFPMGVLFDFSIGADGIITGIFTNGITKPIAQVQLARFANPNGLLANGENLFRVGPNSGQPVIGKPGTFGLGVVRGGVLEASNVDFAREFTNLVISQRSFQANARVIRTADAMLDELVNVV